MNKLQAIGFGLSKMSGRTGLIVQKNLPQILTYTGVVAGVASTVFAIKATLKLDEIVDESMSEIGRVKDAREKLNDAVYPEKDYKHDMAVCYIKYIGEVAKLYAPTVGLGLFSIGCVVSGNRIMTKRNLALMAAYKAVEKSFAKYRERVVENLGETADREFRGERCEMVNVTETDEEGNEVTTEKNIRSTDLQVPGYSIYARFFDESCSEFSRTPGYNLHFLRCQQQYANQLLNARGHVFLNEIYDALGIPRSQEGAIVGWVKDNGDLGGDGVIDFGIYETNKPSSRNFVNGYEPVILLDFNVDGVIYDLI